MISYFTGGIWPADFWCWKQLLNHQRQQHSSTWNNWFSFFFFLALICCVWVKSLLLSEHEWELLWATMRCESVGTTKKNSLRRKNLISFAISYFSIKYTLLKSYERLWNEGIKKRLRNLWVRFSAYQKNFWGFFHQQPSIEQWKEAW